MENKPIRILHILNQLNIGGVENFLMNIFRSIDREEIVFDFLVHGKGIYDQEIKDLGGRLFYLKGYINKIGIKKYKKELKRFLISEGHEYKIIHSHPDQTSGLILPLVKRYTKAVCITHSHSVSNYNNIVVKVYKKWLQCRLNQYTDYRLACSKDAGRWLFGKNDFLIIPNGIDANKFKFNEYDRIAVRKELKIHDTSFVIGHVGRFDSVKNQKFLVDIISEYCKKELDIKLLLIGNGDFENDIKKKVHKLDLENFVIILDSKEDIYRYYNAMDLFVLPSLMEGFGIVAVEAQANGLFVLASNKVPREVKVTDRVKFLSLDDRDEWISQIMSIRKIKFLRTVKINPEYDVKKSGEKLIKLYKYIVFNEH